VRSKKKRVGREVKKKTKTKQSLDLSSSGQGGVTGSRCGAEKSRRRTCEGGKRRLVRDWEGGTKGHNLSVEPSFGAKRALKADKFQQYGGSEVRGIRTLHRGGEDQRIRRKTGHNVTSYSVSSSGRTIKDD